MPNWVSLIVGFTIAYLGSILGRLAVIAALRGAATVDAPVLRLAQWPFIALGAYHAARRGRTAGWIYGGAIGLAFAGTPASGLDWVILLGTVAAGVTAGVAGQRHRPAAR